MIASSLRLSGLLLVLGVAGCMVGPDYKKPGVALAPFHNSLPAGGTQPAPQLDTWWTGFNDPMLVTVVQRALDQNLDLAASFARVQQARASANAAGAQLLPTFDLNASATVEHQSTVGALGALGESLPDYNRDQREYNIGTGASWEIDLFGGLRRGARAARAEAQAARAEQDGTRVTVASDAADAYLQIRAYQARIAVTTDQIDTDTKLLGIVQLRESLGKGEDREVAQAQAVLEQAQSILPPLRIGLEAQLNRLDVLMGVQPGTYAHELAVVAPIPAIPAIGGDDQPLDVLRRRPDVIAAERRLAASNEQIGVAVADYYPKISLSGALGFDSLSTNQLFTAKAFQPIGTGLLRWRLFDFGKVDAEVAQAKGSNAEALAQYRQSILKATEDVEDALVTLSQTEVRVQTLQQEVASLDRARKLSQTAYEAGAIPLTDVLDADRQLLITRDELDADRGDAARAAVKTFRALGGGWDVPPGSTQIAEK
ncbi:efflux transporter outer membrane subunit [Acidisoma cellulosilytica]|uniref:Efflux transporter outer membrane subunit n=1 Tax=Acidisoma cellulosilyticum TaxID=2802395 RepID=A0A963Z1W8_9PROT|nr:efflux transporter outer membrane subunit [Acidisoma cellulosilyticum]MCB8881260.1 efflux transporter outer membrane subunit [Acidisoma cellulosilyticum]